MVFEEAGTYTIEYTATDECGNTTNAERTVIVEGPPRTVLYTDGTFIINERSSDIDANIAAHGQPTNVYIPFDPNGNTNKKKYIFADKYDLPWSSQSQSVKHIEIGSNISPTSTAHWFNNMYNAESINLNNLDTSNVVNMSDMFMDCRKATTINTDVLVTSEVTNMKEMFKNCSTITSLDVSTFDTSKVTDMSEMFRSCNVIKTIYASEDFVVAQVTTSTNMFNYDSQLVGGAGTTYSSSSIDKTRAKIDGGVSDPGYFTAKN